MEDNRSQSGDEHSGSQRYRSSSRRVRCGSDSCTVVLLYNFTGGTLSLEAKWLHTQNKAARRSEETRRSRRMRSVTHNDVRRVHRWAAFCVSASYERGRVMRSCDCSWSRSTAGRFRSVWTRERSSLRTTRSLTTSGELLSPHDSSLCQYMHTHTHSRNKTAGNTLPRSEWIWKWYCTCVWVYECGSVSPGG